MFFLTEKKGGKYSILFYISILIIYVLVILIFLVLLYDKMFQT